jgi:hypothetical protein
MPNRVITFLERVGQDIEKAFAVAAPIIQEAEPFINLTFPGFGPLFSTTANEVISVEQKFAAIGKQTGSGPAKLANVLAVIQPVAAQLLSNAKLPNDATTVTNWINGVVALLNGIPTATAATPPNPSLAVVAAA